MLKIQKPKLLDLEDMEDYYDEIDCFKKIYFLTIGNCFKL